MFDSQTWSRKGMLTMYEHETWSNLAFFIFMNIIAAAKKRSVNTKNFFHYKVQSLHQIKQFLLHHDLTMSDHQTWSVKLSNKYCILIFLNTVKQSKLRGYCINSEKWSKF